MTFTTYGSVRGLCNHLHRTEKGARRCIREDQKGCSSQGGYSDREVYEVKDGYLVRDGEFLLVNGVGIRV